MPPPISAHCTYEEATSSPTAIRRGIDNTPSPDELANMRLVAAECFEPARTACGPLRITSFYRSPALNRAIGGSPTSDHVNGRAIDMEGMKVSNADLFLWCRHHLDFDQLIWEFGDDANPAWVHVGYRSKPTNRHQTIRAVRTATGTEYLPYTPPAG